VAVPVECDLFVVKSVYLSVAYVCICKYCTVCSRYISEAISILLVYLERARVSRTTYYSSRAEKRMGDIYSTVLYCTILGRYGRSR
jgi:hypothetical protein